MKNYWLPPKKINVKFIVELTVTVRTDILDYWKTFCPGDMLEISSIISDGTNQLIFVTDQGKMIGIPVGSFVVL